jgi:hypothetical protein
MRAIRVGPNRRLFITARFWKTLEYIDMGSLRIESIVLVVRDVEMDCRHWIYYSPEFN